ncbi:hypothetical protein [Aurantibacter sp.]|uniref:hypothetical protein n=1 Tax=Aurantibacter sp. TaxID=2807103 RepID=UPI00326519A2
MAEKVLFHIGLHKTATSSLQKDFFTVGHGFFQGLKKSKIMEVFVNKSSTELISSKDLECFLEFVKRANEDSLVPLVSHERLSGYPLSGGYDRMSILNRIKSTGLDVKIIYIIREQKSWIYSAWKQMIIDSSGMKLQEFLMKSHPKHNARLPVPRLEYLNYARDITLLRDMFGEANVSVIPMELMAQDFSYFKSKVSKLLDVDIERFRNAQLSFKNESLSLSEIYFKLFINRYVIRTELSPRGMISSSNNFFKFLAGERFCTSFSYLAGSNSFSALDANNKALINGVVGEYFSEINFKASEMIGIDLKKLGYC